jgi:PEP-CTERM motif
MRNRCTGIFLGLLLTAGTVMASATTINFSSLSGGAPDPSLTGAILVGASYTQAGFTFASGGSKFDVWQASSPNLPSLNPADTSLFEFYAGVTTTLTDGGSPFTLSSIDLAPVIAGGTGTFTVTFTGTHPNTTTISQTLTVNDSPSALQTFAFSGFTNLVSVAYDQGTNSGYFGSQDTAYQFDNVVVSGSSVPEPDTLLMLGSGVLAAAGALRRKLNK